jgi:lipopolysaccharide export system protein LptA
MSKDKMRRQDLSRQDLSRRDLLRQDLRRYGLMAAVGLMALSPLAALSQATQAGKGVPNAMQGFSQNQGKPIQIEAATLEVHDKEKQKFATFEGDVHVIQGDTDMRCKTLVVYYDDDATPARKAAVRPAQPSQSGAPPQQQQQQIKRLDAKGGVIITQKDQIATGESGVYELRTSLMTLVGNVVLTKGGDVIRGDRLWVNMNTGVSRVESANTGQGVRAVFNPSSAHDTLGGAPDTSKPSPGRPPRPN